MTDTDKPASLAEIISSATRSERTATICVAGHLNARHDELDARLRDAVRAASADGSLAADDSEARKIAAEMETVREQMREHEHTFTFRALPAGVWSDLMLAHKPREGQRETFNAATFPLACVAASLVAVNGEEQIAEVETLAPLWNDALNEGQRDELFGAAWEANTGRVDIPFSALASATLARTAEN